jgi:hypothetical protein
VPVATLLDFKRRTISASLHCTIEKLSLRRITSVYAALHT